MNGLPHSMEAANNNSIDHTLRDALDYLPHAVVIVGSGDQVTYVNLAAETLFSSSAAFLVRHKLNYFLPFGSPVLSLIRQVRNSHSPVSEYRVDISTPRTGPGKLVDVYASPVGENNDNIMIMFLARTIAEKIDRQLTHRNAARTVTNLASMLGHEIKNPLSGIRGAAQLLESSASEDDRPLARLIMEEADRIVNIVNRMEVFSDNSPVARSPVNIHKVLERVIRLSENGFARSISICEDYDPSLPPVHGNFDQLVQVFLNLAKNAAEVLGDVEGGKITFSTAFRPGIHLSSPGSSGRVSLPLEFSVSDNGPGITEDIKPYIFDPFVTGKTNGSGLGLALVAKIIGDHGGVIECESSRAGTTFRILMPAYRSDHGEEHDDQKRNSDC